MYAAKYIPKADFPYADRNDLYYKFILGLVLAGKVVSSMQVQDLVGGLRPTL